MFISVHIYVVIALSKLMYWRSDYLQNIIKIAEPHSLSKGHKDRLLNTMKLYVV